MSINDNWHPATTSCLVQGCPVCPNPWPTTGTITRPSSLKIESLPPNSCFEGHDYFETKDGNMIICRRCGTAKAIALL